MTPSHAELTRNYVDFVCDALQDAKQNPAAAAERRKQQMEFVHNNYTWANRAQSWIRLVEAIKSGKA
jgi:glycosyltransferase involved in cell wall biosynthesis